VQGKTSTTANLTRSIKTSARQTTQSPVIEIKFGQRNSAREKEVADKLRAAAAGDAKKRRAVTQHAGPSRLKDGTNQPPTRPEGQSRAARLVEPPRPARSVRRQHAGRQAHDEVMSLKDREKKRSTSRDNAKRDGTPPRERRSGRIAKGRQRAADHLTLEGLLAMLTTPPSRHANRPIKNARAIYETRKTRITKLDESLKKYMEGSETILDQTASSPSGLSMTGPTRTKARRRAGDEPGKTRTRS